MILRVFSHLNDSVILKEAFCPKNEGLDPRCETVGPRKRLWVIKDRFGP